MSLSRQSISPVPTNRDRYDHANNLGEYIGGNAARHRGKGVVVGEGGRLFPSDYCNDVFYRVAAVHPLQSVLKLRKLDRVSISGTICHELHWLPLEQRIVYKLCLRVVFKC